MLARIHSCSVLGIDGHAVAVEVDNAPGTFGTQIVGLPDIAVKESKERVASALKNSGFRYPRGWTLVNLAPADVRKEGSALDLPIAVGMIAASGQMAPGVLESYALAGELALDGSLRPVSGALSMALTARDLGLDGIVLPVANADEAGVVPDIDVIAVPTLNEAGRVPQWRAGDAAVQDRLAHGPEEGAGPRAGSDGSEGPGPCEARTYRRGGWWSQYAYGRSARHREDDARLAPAGYPAGHEFRGSA